MPSKSNQEREGSRKKRAKSKETQGSRYERKIRRVKTKARSGKKDLEFIIQSIIYTITVAKQCTFQIIEIDLFAWNKWKFRSQDYWISPYVDTVPRIDGRSTPKSEFIEKYEAPNRPVVITHLTDEWRGHSLWDEEVSYISILEKKIENRK